MGTTLAIVVAAGRGSRMGTAESKQFLPIAGKPILVHTLEALAVSQLVDGIVLVTGAADVERCRELVRQYAVPKVTAVVAGGAERQDSVREGLKHCVGADWVLVHDGVRPFVGPSQIESVLREAGATEVVSQGAAKAVDGSRANDAAGAAILAVPVKDTIKVARDGVIASTPDRRSLWAIHTPQAFRFVLLEEAHRRAAQEGFSGTDDAMLVERLGVPVRVAMSAYTNVKITTPDDLEWAEWYAGRREQR